MKDFKNPEVNKLINSSAHLTECDVQILYNFLCEEELTSSERKEILKNIPNRKAHQILIFESFCNINSDERLLYNDEMRANYNGILEDIINYKKQYGQESTRKDLHNPLHNLKDVNEIVIDFIYSMIADYNNEPYLVIRNLKDYCYEDFSISFTDYKLKYYKKNANLFVDKYVFLYNNENFYDINNFQLLKSYIRARRYGDAYKLIKENYYTQRIIPNIETTEYKVSSPFYDSEKGCTCSISSEQTGDINDKMVIYKNFDKILKIDLLKSWSAANPNNIGTEIKKIQFSRIELVRTSELLINFMLAFLENREYEDVEYILKIYLNYFRATADIEYITTRLIENKIRVVRNNTDKLNSMKELEKEAYFQEFSENTKSIISNIYSEEIAKDNEDYYKIEADLKTKFGKNHWEDGEDNWDKLDDTSKYFLISSRLIYNDFLRYSADIKDNLDFSAPCILLTKALEREIKLKLYDKLEDKFIGEKPSAYNGIAPFTLGSIKYLTGYEKYPHPAGSINPKPRNRNSRKDTDLFLEAAEKIVFKKGINVNGEWKEGQAIIEEYIKTFSAQVIAVKEWYRDNAAHSGGIELTTTDECYEFLINSEKVLIKFIENYNV